MISFPQKEQKKKKKKNCKIAKLNVIDHVKLSTFLNAQIPVAFKIILI